MRPPYTQAIEESGVLVVLAAFDPHVAGTPPLGIATPTSDIDILCACDDDGSAFTDAVVAAFAAAPGFTIAQWRTGRRAIVARFHCCAWEIEIFAEATPVGQQAGWRHFLVERRLLQLAGEPLREAIVAAKRSGRKTEPAFAAALQLAGDPYEALLGLEAQGDAELSERLRRAGSALS